MKINSKGYIEPGIGEIFMSATFNDFKCQVVKSDEGCTDCIFEYNCRDESVPLACSGKFREDEEEVVFKIIE